MPCESACVVTRYRRSLFLTLLALIGLGCHGSAAPRKLDGIVLVIADGTSLELITAARSYAVGAVGRLALENFAHTAFVRTHSASDTVTDSGASATAIARGIKADNRVIGMTDPGASSGPPSILDIAKRAGWSTAVVTDDSVTGATPAAFLLEHANRDQHEIIAAKLLDQLGGRADIVLGGGSKWFFDRVKDPEVVYKGGERIVVQKTHQNLSALPAAVFDEWESFRAYNPQDNDPIPVLGLFFPDKFSYYADGKRALRLTDLVDRAVSLLRARGKPFFLMVEAALPDKACHENNAKRAIVEVLELDATLAWLRENLGPNTLILVTTDHNTGGFSFNGPIVPLRLREEALLGRNPLTGVNYFTWASGPGADRETSATRTRIVTEPGKPMRSVEETIQETDVDCTQPALIKANSSYHTAGDVWLLGEGPGSEKVRGFLDNTEIFGLMAKEIEESLK
ncbi:MAG TPA: alkaline phosphatase [Terrimicrobiaceae bacterium]